MAERVSMAADENVLTKFLSEHFTEETPEGFYEDLFMVADDLATADEISAHKGGTYSPIIVRLMDDGQGGTKAERHLVSRGLGEIALVNALSVMDKADFLSPISYAGRRPMADMAHELYALTFDLDGIKIKPDGTPIGLIDLIHQMRPVEGVRGPFVPSPTYIVSSGSGLHLYYMLDKPIRLWPDVIERLNAFRDAFTKRLWNRYITDLYDSPQFEPVTQDFRMVGSRSKDGKQVVRAFLSSFRITMESLNQFVPEESRLPLEMRYKQHTLEEARALWPAWDPDWRKKASAATARPWHVKRDLFDWWCRRVEAGEASVGHRYWCVWVAACMAAKCPDVTYDELERWALGMVPMLDTITVDEANHFTERDALSALNAYGNPLSRTLRRDKIAEKTAVEMPVNKRNGREIHQHIQMVNALRKMRRDVLGEDEYRNSGRPRGSGTMRDAIREYAEAHPDANHSQIAKALGVSRPTVIKWLRDA